MNKKTVIFAPLAVLTLGLTSCNKSWPTINKDDTAVKERIDAVIKMRNSLENKTDFPKTAVMNYKSKETQSFKNHNFTTDYSEENKYDIENKYWYETSKTTNSSGSFNKKTYRIYQNNAEYVLNASVFSGNKHSPKSEDDFKSDTKTQIYNVLASSTDGYGVYDELYLNSFEEVVNKWDSFDADFKQYLDGYFKYTFVTNDKTKNIGFVVEKKYTTDLGEGKQTHEEKTEYRYENNLPTYLNSTSTISTEAFGDKPATVVKIESTATISYDTKITQDKINLDDYYIVEENI